MNSLEITVFFNIGSLLLGLSALVMAGFAVGVRSQKRSLRLMAGSFCLCAFSLLLQLAEIAHRVRIGDLSAVMDTIGGILFVGAALFMLTVIINTAAMVRQRKRG